jgi:hypothetical protein
MNRLIRLSISTLALSAGCTVPTDTGRQSQAIALPSARSGDVVSNLPPIKLAKPTLTTTACTIVSTNQLAVTVTWNTETIVDGQPLEVVLELKGKQHLYAKAGGFVVGPYDPQPAFVTFYLDQILDTSGGITWDRFTSISTSTLGAFTDVAPTIRQSSDWPNCVI